jgi:hypothetical protein
MLTGVALAVGASACGGVTVEFDETRARSHIDALAGAIGNRPVASAAAARARQYLIEQLERAGFTVRLQRADAVDERRGLTVPVVNIIALKTGADDAAIALISHYDSAVDAAGALDDALGVAVCLEAGRVLAASPLRHSLLLILTDGEEAGLMGARAVVRDPDVSSRLRVFLNFDGTGAAGPSLLFEAAAGRDGRSALAAWAAGAAAAEGGSFSTEIYRRLPNDTDFSIFRTLGVPGLNFAPVGDSYAYHTDRDSAARVRTETIRHAISNTIGTVRRIDRDGLATAVEPSTFFDIAGRRGVSYGSLAAATFAWAAAAAGTIAWLVLCRVLWRQHGAAGLALIAIGALLTAVIVAGSMAGIGVAVGRLRNEVHFWYAAPHWLFLSTIGAGLLGWTVTAAIAQRVSARIASRRSPQAAWWFALPVWIALTAGLHVTAPAASYLTSLPLLVAAGGVIWARGQGSRLRLASAAVLIVAAHFWVSDTLLLLSFIVPLFGWMGIVPPVWVFAVLIGAALVMCGPPAAAIVAGRRLRLAVVGVLGGAVAIVTILAARAPAYSEDRPERRMLRYVQDDGLKRAWWEQGGPEPRVVADAAASVGQWALAGGAPDTSIGVVPVAGAFRFRVDAPSLVAAPAQIRASATRVAPGRVVLEVKVEPTQYLWATIALPVGVTPLESSLVGRVSSEGWRATCVIPPGGALEARLVVADRDANALAQTTILLQTFAVPEAAAGQRVPAWASNGAVTWQPRGLYVIRASPRTFASVPTGRH